MPKFLVGPDLHTTETGPSSRKDNVLATQMAVLSHFSNKYSKLPLLLPGDVLDKRRLGNEAIISLGKLLGEREAVTIAIPGQHDLRSHDLGTYSQESDLAILEGLVGNLRILGDGEVYKCNGVPIVGYPWASKAWEEVASGERAHKGIGIVHASVCDSAWPGASDINELPIKGTGFLMFGDIHKGFLPTTPKGNKNILCAGGGVLTPMKRNEDYFNCNFFIVDTDANTIKVLPISWEDFGVEFHDDVDDYDVESYVAADFMEKLVESTSQMENEETLLQYINRIAKEKGIKKRVVERLLKEIPDEA